MSKRKPQKQSIPQTVDVIEPASTQRSIDEDRGIERNKYVYDLVNRWIENADNKVSVSCGLFSGVFGVVIFLSERYIRLSELSVSNQCWELPYKVFLFASIFLMVIALFFYARAIIPSLKNTVNKREHENANRKLKDYPIFYRDIQDMSCDEFRRRMTQGTNAAFNDELIQEIWINSGICMKKIKRYKYAVILSLYAIVLALLSFGAHYMMYY